MLPTESKMSENSINVYSKKKKTTYFSGNVM